VIRHDRGSVLPIVVALIGVTSLLLMGVSHVATGLVQRQRAQTAADALALAIAQQHEPSVVVNSFDIEWYSVTSKDDVVLVDVVRSGVEASATAIIHPPTLETDQ